MSQPVKTIDGLIEHLKERFDSPYAQELVEKAVREYTTGVLLLPSVATDEQLQAVHDGPLCAGDHTRDGKTTEWLQEMYKGYVDAYLKSVPQRSLF